MAQFADALRIASDDGRRERRSGSLTQQAATHLMRHLDDVPPIVEMEFDGDAVPTQRIVAACRPAGRGELASAGLGLGERNDAFLVELFAHRKVFAAWATPVSRASMSVLSL